MVSLRQLVLFPLGLVADCVNNEHIRVAELCPSRILIPILSSPALQNVTVIAMRDFKDVIVLERGGSVRWAQI